MKLDEGNGDQSTLQYLLNLSHSEQPEDQQKAAIELSKLVDGAVFPAISYSPLIHAIKRLLPNSNRTVVSYAARALKLLLMDDALRPQTLSSDIPITVCNAVKQWDDEILCLRELLGTLQTLCWDKQCVKPVLQGGIISHLIDYISVSTHLLLCVPVSVTLCLSFVYGVYRQLTKKFRSWPWRHSRIFSATVTRCCLLTLPTPKCWDPEYHTCWKC